MPAIVATYMDDLGRVRISASDLMPNVQYHLQRSTDDGGTWVLVRGGSSIGTDATTVIDDYEYTPNVVNLYRLVAPLVSDWFDRAVTGSWGAADTGQTWDLATDASGDGTWSVDDGTGEVIAPTEDAFYTRVINQQFTNVDITVDVIAPTSNGIGSMFYQVGVRGDTTATNSYRVSVQFAQNGNASIRIFGVAGTSFVNIGTWEAGQNWRIRFRASGTNLVASAWNMDEPAPATWQTAADDDALASGTLSVTFFNSQNATNTGLFRSYRATAIPDAAAASTQVLPEQPETWLKSITHPGFNQKVECVNWDALSRDSRAGLFDVKGRHEILAVTDVGSSASFGLTFLTRIQAQNRAMVALLSFGGVLLLQPPGDVEDECASDYSGIPSGFVVPGGSVQNHSLPGKALWVWEVEFTRVAAEDAAAIVPALITWEQLWAIIGPEGTWQTVWDTWANWQELWLTTPPVNVMQGETL